LQVARFFGLPWGLLCGAYPDSNYSFTPAQRKAVLRAMHSFVCKHQQFALTGGQGRKPLYLYEPDDPLSAMWAKLQVATRKLVTLTDAQNALAEAHTSATMRPSRSKQGKV
jgi:hypothetical protein